MQATHVSRATREEVTAVQIGSADDLTNLGFTIEELDDGRIAVDGFEFPIHLGNVIVNRGKKPYESYTEEQFAKCFEKIGGDEERMPAIETAPEQPAPIMETSPQPEPPVEPEEEAPASEGDSDVPV